MDIDQFESDITKLLTIVDDDGISVIAEDLEIYPALDGCLSAKYKGKSIPCEAPRWADSLGIIADTIRVWDHIE